MPPLEVEHIERLRVVGVRHLAAVGRPLRGRVEAGAAEAHASRLALAVLGATCSSYSPAGIGEVREARAVGRPRRRALVRPGVVVRLRGSPFSAGTVRISPRNSKAARAPDGETAALRIHCAPFTKRGRVSRGPTARRWSSRRAVLRRGIEQVQVAGLLVDDLAAAGRGVEHREVVVRGQAASRCFDRGSNAEEVELAVAIGSEVQHAADPHRVDVVGARRRLRHLLDRRALAGS